MKSVLKTLLFAFVILQGTSHLHAQEDTWWQRLFKKETVEAQKEEPDTTESKESVQEVKEEVVKEQVFDAAASDAVLPFPGQDGEIQIEVPRDLARLDSLYREHPPQIEGYRIQLYFGGLQEARELRAESMLAHPDRAFYLVQNPPNFAVLCGDFRSSLEAYRALAICREEHPSAIIVQSPIDPEKCGMSQWEQP